MPAGTSMVGRGPAARTVTTAGRCGHASTRMAPKPKAPHRSVPAGVSRRTACGPSARITASQSAGPRCSGAVTVSYANRRHGAPEASSAARPTAAGRPTVCTAQGDSSAGAVNGRPSMRRATVSLRTRS